MSGLGVSLQGTRLPVRAREEFDTTLRFDITESEAIADEAGDESAAVVLKLSGLVAVSLHVLGHRADIFGWRDKRIRRSAHDFARAIRRTYHPSSSKRSRS